DAADEGEARVDDRELAMQTPQAAPVEREGVALGPEHRDRARARAEQLADLAGKARRPEAVHHHVHPYAATVRLGKRAGDAPARGIVVEDVGLDEDRVARRFDRPLERGKVLVARFEQDDLVAVLQARLQASIEW